MTNESRDEQIDVLIVFNRMFYAAVVMLTVFVATLILWLVY